MTRSVNFILAELGAGPFIIPKPWVPNELNQMFKVGPKADINRRAWYVLIFYTIPKKLCKYNCKGIFCDLPHAFAKTSSTCSACTHCTMNYSTRTSSRNQKGSGDGWFRFLGAGIGGDALPTTPRGEFHCGTQAAGYGG